MNVDKIKQWMKETEGKGGVARRDHVDFLLKTVNELVRVNSELRENPLIIWEEGEGFQVNGVTVRKAPPAVGGAELYTPCVPVSMIGKRGILRFTVAEEVPPGEAHLRNGAGELVGKITNLGIDPADFNGLAQNAEGSGGRLYFGVDLAAGPDFGFLHVCDPRRIGKTAPVVGQVATPADWDRMMNGGEFQTRDGEAAAHAKDGEWLEPSTNPFGHGCCDCGLYHDVAFRLVDGNGEGENYYRNQFESGALRLQLSFTRNETETARLRAHQAGEVCESCGKALLGEDMATATHDSEDGIFLCAKCHGELAAAEQGEA